VESRRLKSSPRPRRRICSRQAAPHVFACLCLASALFAQQIETRTPDQPTPPAATVTIPDGTKVELRFAQPVWGKTAKLGDAQIEAKPGDKIRLVVVSPVRVSNLVVIAKGAVGEVTVAGVWRPSQKYPDSGVSLKLDWVLDVTGEQVPLRLSPAGRGGASSVDVMAEKGGFVVRPDELRHDLIQAMTMTYLITMLRQKSWIPAGARMMGYVHGAVAVDAAELQKAQTELPVANPTATVTIFRTKGHRETPIRIQCDGNDLGQIGARQYVTTELAPGKHSCQAQPDARVQLETEAGGEYFVYLHSRGWSGSWELKPVSTAEGEDGTAGSELAAK